MNDPTHQEAVDISARRRVAAHNAQAERKRTELDLATRLKDKGLSNAAIARELGLSESTVRVILDPPSTPQTGDKLYLVMLTEKQYETAMIALGMLEAGDEESEAVNASALNAFTHVKVEVVAPKDDTVQKLHAEGLSLEEIAERTRLEPIEVKYILADIS